jgi:hypothetical protein
MLLRASGEREQGDYDLHSVTADAGDSGVAHSDLLRALTEQAISSDWAQLAATREHASRAMGAQQTVDALTVAAAFNGITRVADATGIPLDPVTAEETVEMRARTGIDEYAYERKSARLGGRVRDSG